MKIALLALISLPFLLFSQTEKGVKPTSSTNSTISTNSTRAVVIGISGYQDEGITDLQFAHRDAEAFANYLRSSAGGSIPPENLRLRTNEQATLAEIKSAIFWLVKQTQPGDRAIFYFSGHGDVETLTDWHDAFLLAYDTKNNNYPENALEINYLEKCILTLSTGRNAEVVVITDACRSGKLAGSQNNGPGLTAEQLARQTANEIRIMSCRHDQVSLESHNWGGGRGLFSWHLLNGLIGLADDLDPDSRVTKEEIEGFLKKNIRQDLRKISENARQDPVFKGDNSLFVLSHVDEPSLAALQAERSNANAEEPPMLAASAPDVGRGAADSPTQKDASPGDMTDAFFKILKKRELLEKLNFEKIAAAGQPQIVPVFLEEIKSKVADFPISRQEEDILKNPNLPVGQPAEIAERLALTLHEYGQSLLNAYLEADTLELRKRGYYSNHALSYDRYPLIFATALRLLDDAEHPLTQGLKLKQHYFAGVAARLKIAKTADFKPLLDRAFEEQQRALALNPGVAYVHNELGILYQLKNDAAGAEAAFRKAIALAPTWAIPQANICGLFATSKDFRQARAFGEKALALQPELTTALNNLGFAFESNRNLLFAEELYRKSMPLDYRHFYPFERMGYVCLATTRYAEADSFFLEAELRKKGLVNFSMEMKNKVNQAVDAPIPNVLSPALSAPPPLDGSVTAEFFEGWHFWHMKNYTEAEQKFRSVIAREPQHPLAFHFLGRVFSEQEDFEAAEIMFLEAEKHFLDDKKFEEYVRRDAKKHTENKDFYRNALQNGRFSIEDNLWQLADVYENWQHFDAAEKRLRQLLALNPADLYTNRRLWTFLEDRSRFFETETALTEFSKLSPEEGFEETRAFFVRMTERFPSEPDWFYKLGLLLYPSGEGIFELKKTVQLDSAHPARANIFQKIGDYYLDRSNWQSAAENFEKAVAALPADADSRLKIVDICNPRFGYRQALPHLEFLFDSQQITFPKRLLLAKYWSQTGRFGGADSLLTGAERLSLFPSAEITGLWARLFSLSGQTAKAIEKFRELERLRGKSAAILYAIARSQAQLGGDGAVALDALETALSEGFQFEWVLKYDDSWASLRGDPRWDFLMKKHFPVTVKD